MTDISGHVKVFKQQCTVMNRRISSTWLTVHPINVTMAYLQDETQPPILRNTVNICCFRLQMILINHTNAIAIKACMTECTKHSMKIEVFQTILYTGIDYKLFS